VLLSSKQLNEYAAATTINLHVRHPNNAFHLRGQSTGMLLTGISYIGYTDLDPT